MEKRIHDFIPEIKDYYTVTSDGEFYSDNSGKMKTRKNDRDTFKINDKLSDIKKEQFSIISLEKNEDDINDIKVFDDFAHRGFDRVFHTCFCGFFCRAVGKHLVAEAFE